MPTSAPRSRSGYYMTVLSRLLITPRSSESNPGMASVEPAAEKLRSLQEEEFGGLVELAGENHVLVRGMEALRKAMLDAGDERRAGWAEQALTAERARIGNAMQFLKAICSEIANSGHDVTVIKSLDHWPDLGSDLDLYTNAPPRAIVQLMKQRFEAALAPRSWGDRLAHKWNFLIPGLPEAVEIHMGRLGQTGEQVAIAASVPRRSREVVIEGVSFQVPAISDRILISTLQRMYRHFYFRLCDILDSAQLADAGLIDYHDLRRSARVAEIWEGTATYLVIVSDYMEQYRGWGLDLPQFVRETARFGGRDVKFGKSFLRVPILPQSAGLYGAQLAGMMRKMEFHNSARLGLLPWLATAALVGQKITGSDKGIW